MQQTKNVMKFNTALGDPFYVDVSRLENPSVDRVLIEAISNLTAQGRPLEAQQLEQLASNHQLFNANRVVSKGALFNALEATKTQVGEATVNVVEVNLMASHAGGVECEHQWVLKERLKHPSKRICQLCGKLSYTKYTPTVDRSTFEETVTKFEGGHW